MHAAVEDGLAAPVRGRGGGRREVAPEWVNAASGCEAGHARWQVWAVGVAGMIARGVSGRLLCERRPVDRVVDGLAQLGVREQRAARVESEEGDPRIGSMKYRCLPAFAAALPAP